MTTRQYKDFKNFKKENLIDNMSTLELILNMIAEATTTELTQTFHPQGLEENKELPKKVELLLEMLEKILNQGQESLLLLKRTPLIFLKLLKMLQIKQKIILNNKKLVYAGDDI